MTEERDHAEIREAVGKLCEGFPGEYWRGLDREMAYPSEFVAALGGSGFLAALIPEAYGGAGLALSAAAAILEEIQRAGCNGAACHAQMYIMGALLRHGNAAQKGKYLPQIASGALRLQAFGVTEPTSGTDTSSIKTVAQRVQGREQTHRRALGLHPRYARRQECRAHHPADPHHDEPFDDRGVLRQR